jgi:hypothetical protein
MAEAALAKQAELSASVILVSTLHRSDIWLSLLYPVFATRWQTGIH